MIAALVLLALALCLAGIVWRVIQFACTPQLRYMPLTPAPFSRRGQLHRVVSELFLFKTLFRSSTWTWVFAWLIGHLLLAAILFDIVLMRRDD